jgi:hypothetical protein
VPFPAAAPAPGAARPPEVLAMPVTNSQLLELLAAVEAAGKGEPARLHEVLTPDLVTELLDERSMLEKQTRMLRQALLYEAGVVQAHYEGYKSFPKRRLGYAQEQVARMERLGRELYVTEPFHLRYRAMQLDPSVAVVTGA